MSAERPEGFQSAQDLERPVAERLLIADRAGVDEGEPRRQPNGDFAELRTLLLGPEQRRIAELATRIEGLQVNPTVLAEHLPDAIALRASRDRQLGRALAPTVETALHESVRRNPREVAAAIFPVLGPAIRKAMAETMAALVRSINGAVEHSLSPQGIKWRIEAWRTGVPYPEVVIKHALVYRVEQVFLIHAESGLLLQHVSAAGLEAPNADLVSAMLTAIQDFVRDSFRPNEGATLRAFSVGEHTVQLEVGPRALLAAVVRGTHPESLTQRVQATLERVHMQWAQQLVDFSGDASVFEPARPLLEECLETVLATEQRASRAKHVWLRWTIPVAALALLAAGLTIRSRVNWQTAIRTLDAEPGIVLVNAARDWGTWRFTGLKDPMARDPAVVLAAAGFSPRAISGRWDPYLALDSAVVVTRARRSLGAAPATTIDLRADTLVVAGTATVDWLAGVRRAALPAGVATVDASSITPVLPHSLDSTRQALAGELILFDAGSSHLSPASIRQLRSVAVRVERLNTAVAAAGVGFQLALIGRTDPTGSDSTNRNLAQLRINEVSRQLISLGVPADVFVRQPVATDRPLGDQDPLRRARINRSVAFDVSVHATPPPPPSPR